MNDNEIFEGFNERERLNKAREQEQLARLDARADLDEETGTWLPRACVVCGEDTRLRCGGCRAPVCHFHELCPNGC